MCKRSNLTSEEKAELREIDNDMLWYDVKYLLGEKDRGEPPEVHIKIDYTVKNFEDVEDEYPVIFSRHSDGNIPRPVKISDIANAFELCMEEWEQFLNRTTVEIVSLSTDLGCGREGDEMLWDKIEYSFDYVRLPDQYELHERNTMKDFAYELQDDNIRGIFLNALHGAHPDRRFKNLINQYDYSQAYYDFRTHAYLKKAEKWCEENHILCRK